MDKIIFGLVGGLGLFIFGMKYFSDALQMIGSKKIKKILRSLTDNKIKGMLMGTLVTSVVQSSSVTTVILIGLINAGIINFMQSASVVMGANIGTTITAQIIAFKIAKYALPGIAIGVVMMFVGKRRQVQSWGQVIFSLGIIFLGLATMSSVVKPLKNVPEIIDFFVLLSKTPILAIGVGAIFTVLVQSSSASIGMLIALAAGGLIDFQAALYILLGDNIGTTITAWLASIGGTTSAKRMAFFHTVFNIMGALYFCVLIYIGFYAKFVDFITPGPITTETIARNIANAHSFFNIFNAILFLPFVGIVVVFIKKLLPGEDLYVDTGTQYLQNNLLTTPAVALESARKEIAEMAKTTRKIFKTAVEGFIKKNKKCMRYVSAQEDLIDNMQYDITHYLTKISTDTLSKDLAEQLPSLIHSINDIERISDHSYNIAQLIQRSIDNKVVFNQKTYAEIQTLYQKLIQMFDHSIEAILKNSKESADYMFKLEEQVNEYYKTFLNKHTSRLIHKENKPDKVLIFVELLNNFEKIGDHLKNIAQAASGHFDYGKIYQNKKMFLQKKEILNK